MPGHPFQTHTVLSSPTGEYLRLEAGCPTTRGVSLGYPYPIVTLESSNWARKLGSYTGQSIGMGPQVALPARVEQRPQFPLEGIGKHQARVSLKDYLIADAFAT